MYPQPLAQGLVGAPCLPPIVLVPNIPGKPHCDLAQELSSSVKLHILQKAGGICQCRMVVQEPLVGVSGKHETYYLGNALGRGSIAF